jgi:hypothetical protein
MHPEYKEADFLIIDISKIFGRTVLVDFEKVQRDKVNSKFGIEFASLRKRLRVVQFMDESTIHMIFALKSQGQDPFRF